ncbi:hypothetical protein B0H19DRAFT_1370683 [Mycena capillaripes]|nr:hypothetical protein B0H19DRAFT_1370683 [Mycena capillaripes]
MSRPSKQTPSYASGQGFYILLNCFIFCPSQPRAQGPAFLDHAQRRLAFGTAPLKSRPANSAPDCVHSDQIRASEAIKLRPNTPQTPPLMMVSSQVTPPRPRSSTAIQPKLRRTTTPTPSVSLSLNSSPDEKAEENQLNPATAPHKTRPSAGRQRPRLNAGSERIIILFIVV